MSNSATLISNLMKILKNKVVVPKKSPVATAVDALNPIKGDPTAVFINYASVFSVVYGLANFIFPHHIHQDKVYPYMKSKRRTLAFMFTN